MSDRLPSQLELFERRRFMMRHEHRYSDIATTVWTDQYDDGRIENTLVEFCLSCPYIKKTPLKFNTADWRGITSLP